MRLRLIPVNGLCFRWRVFVFLFLFFFLVTLREQGCGHNQQRRQEYAPSRQPAHAISNCDHDVSLIRLANGRPASQLVNIYND